MEFKLTLRGGVDFSTSHYDGGKYGIYTRFPESYEDSSDVPFSILADVQEAIEEASVYEFKVIAFDERWPEDLRTDFFLRQLPDAIEAAKSFVAFSIEFTEQETHCIMQFMPDGDSFTARLKTLWSRGKADVTPVVEKVAPAELLSMFRSVRDDYLSYLAKEAPRIAAELRNTNFFLEPLPV